MDYILSRRSIRKYKENEVSDEMINEIVKAGMNAPAARNLKVSEYIIIKEKEVLKRIVEKNSHAHMLNEAPVGIVVCGKEASEFWVQDLAASTENILLKATELGLGSCWIGIYPIDQKEKDMKEILNIPEDIRVFSLISIGYANEEKEMNNVFDKLRVHLNSWK